MTTDLHADKQSDPFDLSPVQVVVPAQDGSAPTGIASSVFDWRGITPTVPIRNVAKKVAKVANPPAQESSLANPLVSEIAMSNVSTVPSATSAPHETGSAGPRFRLLAVLAANGVMQREQIASDTGLQAHRLSQVICEAKKANMLRRLNDGVYEITDAGRSYVMADHAGADAKFAKPRKVQPPSTSAPRAVTAETASQHAFVASLDTAGNFMIAKDGNNIELDASEYRELQRYLRRVEGVVA